VYKFVHVNTSVCVCARARERERKRERFWISAALLLKYYLSLIDILGEYEGVVRRKWGVALALFV
jgi:hypothetical protein